MKIKKISSVIFALTSIALLSGCGKKEDDRKFTANILSDGLKFYKDDKLVDKIDIELNKEFSCTIKVDYEHLKEEFPELTPIEDYRGMPSKLAGVSVNGQIFKDYTFDFNSGEFKIPAEQVTGNIYISGEPSVKDPFKDWIDIDFFCGFDTQFTKSHSLVESKFVAPGSKLNDPTVFNPEDLKIDDYNDEVKGGTWTFDHWVDIDGNVIEPNHVFSKTEYTLLIAEFKYIPNPNKLIAHYDKDSFVFYGDQTFEEGCTYTCYFEPCSFNYYLDDSSLTSIRVGGVEKLGQEGYTFESCLAPVVGYKLTVSPLLTYNDIDITIKGIPTELGNAKYEYNNVTESYDFVYYYLSLIDLEEQTSVIRIDDIHYGDRGNLFVRAIKDGAFINDVPGLWEALGHPIKVILPNHLEEIGKDVFTKFRLTESTSEAPVSMVIPRTVTSIGEYAFSAENYTDENSLIYSPYRDANAMSSQTGIDPKWNSIHAKSDNEDDKVIPVEYRGDADLFNIELSQKVSFDSYALGQFKDITNIPAELILPNFYYDYDKAGSIYSFDPLYLSEIQSSVFGNKLEIKKITLPNNLRKVGSNNFETWADDQTIWISPESLNEDLSDDRTEYTTKFGWKISITAAHRIYTSESAGAAKIKIIGWSAAE